MATILEFARSSAAPRDQQTSSMIEGGAEIIIFPGVRYERWEEPASATDEADAMDVDDTPKPRRRSGSGRTVTAARKKPRAERKRDILEIPD